MPDKRSAPRKYAMTRLGKGDYLLPSNDARWLWRVYTYEEDGSAENFQGRVIKGTFWACARRPMPREGAFVGQLLEWTDWEFWAGPFESRAEAIEEALRVAFEPVAAANVPDEVVMRCATCGKTKPNDAAWARPATCCGESRWSSSITFTDTFEGPVVTGDVRYGTEVPNA